MATLSPRYITLLDVAKRTQSNNGIADIIEMLSSMSPVARAGYAQECNAGKKNETTQRTSLPSPTWVQFYSRIQPTKSTTRQVEDSTGMLENMTNIDKRLYNITKDKATLRLQEAMGVLEGFAQEIEQTFFYGDTGSAPLEFLGLAPRMNSTAAENGRMIITVNGIVGGGGTGSTNTSIYGTTWGPRTGFLLYPENTQAGVEREDKGEVRSETTGPGGGVIYYMEEVFRQHIGYAMPDWRYHFRIPNIDINSLGTSAEPDLVNLIVTAYYRLPSYRSTTAFSSEGQPVKTMPTIYCNSIIKEHLHKQMMRQPNSLLRPGEFLGEEVMTLLNMPILETDGIINTETAVL
jgi:hypothetical protein